MTQLLRGRISDTEGLRDALEIITTFKDIGHAVLEVNASSVAGRVGIAWGRYITGAVVTGSDEIGRKALRQLLKARDGSFVFFDNELQPGQDLRQSLGIELERVAAVVPELRYEEASFLYDNDELPKEKVGAMFSPPPVAEVHPAPIAASVFDAHVGFDSPGEQAETIDRADLINPGLMRAQAVSHPGGNLNPAPHALAVADSAQPLVFKTVADLKRESISEDLARVAVFSQSAFEAPHQAMQDTLERVAAPEMPLMEPGYAEESPGSAPQIPFIPHWDTDVDAVPTVSEEMAIADAIVQLPVVNANEAPIAPTGVLDGNGGPPSRYDDMVPLSHSLNSPTESFSALAGDPSQPAVYVDLTPLLQPTSTGVESDTVKIAENGSPDGPKSPVFVTPALASALADVPTVFSSVTPRVEEPSMAVVSDLPAPTIPQSSVAPPEVMPTPINSIFGESTFSAPAPNPAPFLQNASFPAPPAVAPDAETELSGGEFSFEPSLPDRSLHSQPSRNPLRPKPTESALEAEMAKGSLFGAGKASAPAAQPQPKQDHSRYGTLMYCLTVVVVSCASTVLLGYGPQILAMVSNLLHISK